MNYYVIITCTNEFVVISLRKTVQQTCHFLFKIGIMYSFLLNELVLHFHASKLSTPLQPLGCEYDTISVKC